MVFEVFLEVATDIQAVVFRNMTENISLAYAVKCQSFTNVS
jgi:hypothetical protein